LNSYGVANIVDCHSFPNKAFQRDFHQERNRPDICIGVDDFHTPKRQTDSIKAACEKFGLSWRINYPYEGTVVPMRYYRIDSNVNSIMIEINRDLYIDNQGANFKKIAHLNEFVNDVCTFEKYI
jgi:N-formylglutamate deformylase